MNKQEQENVEGKEKVRAYFATTMINLAEKYGVTLKIHWDEAVLDFQGELTGHEWETLIGEINLIAKQMGVSDGEQGLHLL